MRNGTGERQHAKTTEGAPFVIGRGDRRYEITRVISHGGMGTVHLGRMVGPLGFAKRVAIKSLRPDHAENPATREMFVNEARLTARLNHANIASTVDVLVEDDAVYIVMEYIDGCSVADLCKNARAVRRSIPIEVACAIAHDALLGLDYAHDASDEQLGALRVVHCDVSPQNVRVGRDGLARILDFGIARASEGVHTTTTRRANKLHGKIPYMAPEQLQGETLDRRADVYGMGVLLWEMLAGRRLFSAETAPAVVSQVLQGTIEPPSRFAPHVPPELDEIVMTALSRDRKGRFASAGAMAARLAPFVGTRREVAETLHELSPSEYTPVSGIRHVRSDRKRSGAIAIVPPAPPPIAELSGELPIPPLVSKRMRAVFATLAIVSLGFLGLAIGAARRASVTAARATPLASEPTSLAQPQPIPRPVVAPVASPLVVAGSPVAAPLVAPPSAVAGIGPSPAPRPAPQKVTRGRAPRR